MIRDAVIDDSKESKSVQITNLEKYKQYEPS
jgi:hypothetical protein